MSSNIKIQRVCEHCDSEFTAHTTVTKFCSHSCSKKAWKKRDRDQKINKSDQETKQKLSLPIEKIKANAYLTIPEAASLLRVSRSSIYRIIWTGALKVIKVKSKTIVSKKDLDDFLLKSTQPTNSISEEHKTTEETELISFPEIIHLYNISDRTLYEMAKRKQINKRKIMGTNFVPKSQILKIFGNPKNIKNE